MPQSNVLEVNLPEEYLEFVRGKVASGEYRSASDFVHHSIQTMIEDEQELRRFERDEVVAAYEESLADPSSAIPIDQVRRNLREAFEQRYKAG
jgi:putative addiction module CopG family antidote